MNSLLRITSLFLALLATSCVKKKDPSAGPGEGPYEITTTIGMIADVTREIVGDRANVTNLIGEGTDPHVYKTTKGDIDRLNDSHLVLYNGLHLEGKMGQALEAQKEAGKPVFAVAETVLLPDYDIIGTADDADPHVWMDVNAWSRVTEGILAHLIDFDPDHQDTYLKNFAAYSDQLTALDQYAKKSIASIPADRRVLVTAHDAFSYLGRAYGIEVRGIQGISTESEAGLKEINDLVDYLVTKNIPAVFVESSVSDKSVKALIEGAKSRGHQVIIGGELFSDAMGPKGTYEGTYLGMIDHNITTITRSLGGTAPEKGLHGKLSH
ncbi:MAG: metal ABC transporter solute-binding protein, Zn/Mn family [Verrucomicrobiaceae bacterium]